MTAAQDPPPIPSTACTTIAEVIARMEEIDGGLARKDGVAYFNRLYLEVTKAVQAATANVTFAAPEFTERLDVVFAGLYFAAEITLGTGATCPVAWRPLMQERGNDCLPIQFAIAGMNAHINHDLPIAVVQTCKELGVAPDDGSPQHVDYQRINGLLGEVEGQVAGWFETGVVADLVDCTPKGVDNAVAMWSISDARDLAWDHAKVLWDMRHTPLLADAYGDVLGRLVELSGRGILV
ncbi:MAG TPA: DUF5995 family protein [Solirubrobacteraceae bacterium]|nr:DUF5995 family protein [Solirubrobacteraceae bacterium]